MVFNSAIFLFFLTVTLGLYFRLGRMGQNRLLLAASLVFYGWWDARFLILLLVTCTVDFHVGRAMSATRDERRRRGLLLISLISNLSILGFFKYFGFFAESAVKLLNLFGFEATPVTLRIVLPVGISFYTFQSLSYVVDVYRRQLAPADSLPGYVLFVSFFPQLVAGPIERATHLLPQFSRARVVTAAAALDGVWMILLGYVKKVVIADRLSAMVQWGFDGAGPPFPDARAWLVLYAFAFVIYGDFSGYSDIARGLSRLMGFDLQRNFAAPYLVRNPAAFWRNWHISLSTWLRDYLYIPLGGNRGGAGRTQRNLMLTMLLGGLWHGAGPAFVVWGLYHGLLLVAHRWLLRLSPGDPETEDRRAGFSAGVARVAGVVFFYHLTCLGWLVFKAGTLPVGADQIGVVTAYLRALFQLPATLVDPLMWPLALLGGLCLLLQGRYARMERFSEWSPGRQAAATVAALALIAGLGVLSGAQFIYFQF